MDNLLERALPYYFFGLLKAGRSFENTLVTEAQANRRFLEMYYIPERISTKHKRLIYLAMNRMIQEGLIEAVRDDFADTFISFRTPEEKVGPIAAKFKAVGEQAVPWLRTAYYNICEQVTDEAIDTALGFATGQPEHMLGGERAVAQQEEEEDTWEPLPIDRDDPRYRDAISAAEEAIEVIQGNNGYAQTEPAERNAIVETIKGNVKALKEGSPSLATIKAGLITPLRYLAKKFADAVIGVASKVAVEKLLVWLSHVISF